MLKSLENEALQSIAGEGKQVNGEMEVAGKRKQE